MYRTFKHLRGKSYFIIKIAIKVPTCSTLLLELKKCLRIEKNNKVPNFNKSAIIVKKIKQT